MTLKKQNISFAETKQFSKLFLDYINGDDKLREFYSYAPEIDSFGKVILDKSEAAINRELLVEVLFKQYSKLPPEPIVKRNIELLLNNKTFTVCTGHQLCLFTGPLYFIYKIISTINLAEALKKKYPEYNFVPVYWMASEDHDFEEVKSIQLFGKTISWNNPEAKGGVGRLNTHSLRSVLDEMKTLLGESSKANELIQLFTEAYIEHSTLADATRYFVHELFKEYGLVIIDPDSKDLKMEFVDIIKDDVFNNTNHQHVNTTIAGLEKMNIKPQVNPREINCFYMLDNIRERIENDGNVFQVLNTDIKFTSEQLKTEIELHPDRFSPNVVLRPLYQQKILPNIAYVGGPGEIAYWLEYKAMFDHHRITFPVLMPRNFAMISDEKSTHQLSKLGFEMKDVFRDLDELIKEFINKNTDLSLSFSEQEIAITNVFEALATKVVAVDATLRNSVEAEKQKSINAIKNIESKLLRAEKQKQETSVNQIKKLKDKFIPEGILQERYDNFIPFYLRSGKNFIPELKSAFEPFAYEMLILE